MINASFPSPQLLSLLGREGAAPAQIAAEVVTRLAEQMQRDSARTAQAAAEQGDAGQGLGSLSGQAVEQFGAKTMPSNPVGDQEMLDRTREALAQLERDTKACAEDLAVQERRLAQARQPLATAGTAEDRAWVEIWHQNVQRTREDYASMQALLRETRARYGVSARRPIFAPPLHAHRVVKVYPPSRQPDSP